MTEFIVWRIAYLISDQEILNEIFHVYTQKKIFCTINNL